MTQSELLSQIKSGGLDGVFKKYYNDVQAAQKRFCNIVRLHEERFGEKAETALFSAPGRTEISGNHTDHQRGMVLAGAINLDAVAVVTENSENKITVHSIGHEEVTVDLSVLTAQEAEKGSSYALIRGMAYKFAEMGLKIGGFDAYTASDVFPGSGISSSAAFEVLIGTIMNIQFNGGKLSAVEIAKISQFAEREYFGKPSGLMDQTACAVGGCVEIDFKDLKNPIITPIKFDLGRHRYKLVITNTGANHVDLGDDYASVPGDMLAVARYFGKDVLREVDKAEFMKNISGVRKKLGDKAVLRAIHFFDENERLPKVADALRADDIEGFFKLIRESGKSSFEHLQNIYSDSNPKEQSIALALALSESVLGDVGACRVHGGGFAGTIQAFVRDDLMEKYVKTVEGVFGEGACLILNIRADGGVKLF